MIKHFQNQVAESRMTLPVVAAYAMGVWLLSGLIIPPGLPVSWNLGHVAWVQLFCFVLSTYLMVELNNSNALIRIYSRTVSCAFLILSCCACFVFPSMGGAIVELCIIASYTTAFHTYQDKLSMGWTYYAFLCVGLGSLVYVHVLYFVPFLWLLMQLQLNSLSWRTFFASLLGLVTPYWFAACWLIYQKDFSLVASHFLQLADIQFPFDYSLLTLNQILVFAFVVALTVTGIIHYWRTSFNDKIRIRQLYGCFIWMSSVSTVMLILQPQHYDLLIRVLIINASPLVAHFVSLTHTRTTNIAFYAICVVALLLTAFSLWMPSFSF